MQVALLKSTFYNYETTIFLLVPIYFSCNRDRSLVGNKFLRYIDENTFNGS
jgi:hypothetical protein